MSYEISIYLGPHAVCSAVIVSEQRLVRSCSNQICISHHRHITNSCTLFCERCGSPISENTQTVERITPSAGDVAVLLKGYMQSVHEALKSGHYDEKRHIWIPNFKRTNCPRRSIGFSCSYYEEFSNLDQHAECEEFKTEFLTEIETLRGAYNNVKILWGFLCWRD